MTTFGFTLQLEGPGAVRERFSALSEALFPYAPDCTPAFRSGTTYIGFDRDARSLREAVASAIESVHRADPSVTVVGVILDDGQPIDDLVGTAAA